MVCTETTARSTPTVGGFMPIAYPPVREREWNGGREDVIQLVPENPLPAWVRPVCMRFVELSKLRTQLNPRAPQDINREDTQEALKFLALAMNSDSPLPGIVVLPSGGIELHWAVGDTDLEVIFDEAEAERVALLEIAGEEHDMTPEEAAACVDFLGRPGNVAG